MEERPPRRKHPPHHATVEGFNQSAIILVTVCTADRRKLLARSEAVAMLLDAWQQAKGWAVGRYTILPDHLHLFCAPAQYDGPSLAAWVGFWKSHVSRRWPWMDERPVWQQNFWDRQLRNAEHYGARWEYVRNNPVRHGLVEKADEWPWQGELNEFRFHDRM